MLKTFVSKKNPTDVELMKASSFVIVVNMPNHESLVAGTLLKVTLLAAGIPTTLVDIRDTLIHGETFVWVGVGEREDLEDYFQEQLAKKDFKAIMDRSIFVNRTGEVDVINIADGLVCRLADLATEAGADSFSMRKWAMPSMNFHRNEMDDVLSCQYYRVVGICYDAYYADTKICATLLDLDVEASNGGVVEQKMTLQSMNKPLGRKILEFGIGDGALVQTNTLGPDVHVILRRLGLAKKAFAHISMGCYGVVVYSNSDKPLRVFKELSLLKIQEG